MKVLGKAYQEMALCVKHWEYNCVTGDKDGEKCRQELVWNSNSRDGKLGGLSV